MDVNFSFLRVLGFLLLLCGIGTLVKADPTGVPVETTRSMIQIPDEELPRQSAPPILDDPSAFQNPIIKFPKRFELISRAGWLLDEPFYQPFSTGIQTVYHLDEIHSLGIFYEQWATGESELAQQFGQSSAKLEFNRAPGPKDGYGVLYGHRIQYGKVNMGQDLVLPMTLNLSSEVGFIRYDTKALPYLSAGAGPQIYLDQHWNFGLVVKLIARQIVDPLSQSLRATDTEVRDINQYSTSTRYGFDLNFNIGYLF